MRDTDAAIAAMTFPVRCLRCVRGVYDLGKVEVTARYTDCSMWKTPCCGAVVDDRSETGWTSRKDYERIDPANPNPWQVDEYGNPIFRLRTKAH